MRSICKRCQKKVFQRFIRSSSADVKQNKRSRVYHPKIQNFSNCRLEVMSILEIITLWDVKTQLKAREYLFKIQHFSNFMLVSLSRHPRSCRSGEPIRQGGGHWSRPPKPALERSDLTEKFQFWESHTEAEAKKSPDQISVLSTKRIVVYRHKDRAAPPSAAPPSWLLLKMVWGRGE